MVPKVRKFNTGVVKQEGQKPASVPNQNLIPNISEDMVASIAANAPVKIRSSRGNPRKRRYKQKTYSLLQEDIDLVEKLVADIRQAGLYERGRSDIIRAGIHYLQSLSLEEKIKAVNIIESLKS